MAWDIDQRRVILISDYLIAAVRQLRSNIMACASHRKVLSEKWYAESSWIRARWSSNPGMSMDVALYRGERELERLAYIDNAIRGFFASVGSALDSLGTIFVGLAAINVPITEASWSTVASSTRWLGQACKALEPLKTSGRVVQDKCIRDLAKAVPAMPANWLEWTLDMRNALVHRGVRISPTKLDHDRRAGLQAALLLPTDPKFTDAEAFARSRVHQDVYLREHAEVTMGGVFDKLQDLTVGFVTVFSKLWADRVANPTLIIQPGKQWQSLELTPRVGFAGMNPTLGEVNGGVRINPDDGRRWTAAKVLDLDSAIWREIKKP